jgi:hypothetical protein
VRVPAGKEWNWEWGVGILAVFSGDHILSEGFRLFEDEMGAWDVTRCFLNIHQMQTFLTNLSQVRGRTSSRCTTMPGFLCSSLRPPLPFHSHYPSLQSNPTNPPPGSKSVRFRLGGVRNINREGRSVCVGSGTESPGFNVTSPRHSW